MIQLLDKALNKLYRELFEISDEYEIGGTPKAFLFNTLLKNRMRDLGPSEIDKLITIKGICVRNSEIIPDMKIVL